MTRRMNNVTNGLLGLGAVVMAVAVMPATAKADRWDRDRHEWHDRDHRGEARVEVDLRAGGSPICGPAPVVVDRPQQVWVEPVYRTVTDRVWVAPAYQSVCEKVWVPERTEVRDVRHGHGRVTREVVVVAPGHYEDVSRQVLVADGHWEDVQRQELVAPGHWETHIERVAVVPPPPPAPRGGLSIDLHLPIR